MSNIIRATADREERPTRKMRPEDLLGLVKTSAEKPVDLSPDIEIVDPHASPPPDAPPPDDDLAIPVEVATGSGAMRPADGPYVIRSHRPAPASRAGTWIAILAVVGACAIVTGELVGHHAAPPPAAASRR